MLPRDTNERGTIFGGRILELIDLAAAVQARRYNPRHRYVTVAMKEVVFHEPVEVGDIVSCYAVMEKVGRTSITIKVDVVAERGRDLAEVNVTEAEVVFVSVDSEGRPVPVRDASSA
jgi:acyl-CoA thioesterase YciA